MDEEKNFAVLTGDLIKSGELANDELDDVRSSLRKRSKVVGEWESGLVEGRLEFFRGDSWQMLLGRPELAMRAAVYLRASLIASVKADSRISIGLGTIDNISERQLLMSTGEAFSLSGHGLDELTGYSEMTIKISRSSDPLFEWLPVVANLCNSLIKQWTRRQAEVITFAVDPEEPTHEEIAGKLTPAVTKQAVTKILNSANWHSLREVINQFEKMNWDAALGDKD